MQTRRILIVDDAPEFAHLVKDALSTMDIPLQVTIYLSGEEAWLEALKTRFDLVITDLRLPGISGTELVRRIRARFPRIKIIAVSGLQEAGLDDRTRAAGVDAFYRKPVEMPLLLTKIDNLLSDLSRDMVVTEPEVKPAPPPISRMVTMPLKPLPEDNVKLPADAKVASKPEPVIEEPVQKKEEFKPLPMDIKEEPESIQVKKDGPDDATIMRDVEQRLIKLMTDCNSGGVALTTQTGGFMFRHGSAEDFDFPQNLISACENLNKTVKKTDTKPEDRIIPGLLMFSGGKFDIYTAVIDRFFIWLLFPSDSQVAVASGVADMFFTTRESLQFIMQMLSKLPESENSKPQAADGVEQKGTVRPMNTDELKLTTDHTGKKSSKSEVDSFWDYESDNSSDEGITPGTISFDKAASLGLVPPKKDGK